MITETLLRKTRGIFSILLTKMLKVAVGALIFDNLQIGEVPN